MNDHAYELGGAPWDISTGFGRRLRSLMPGRFPRTGVLLGLAAGAGLLTITLYHWLLGLTLAGESPLAGRDYNTILHRASARIAAVLHLLAGAALLLAIYRGLRGWSGDRLRGWCWLHRRIGLTAAVLVGAANAIWFSGELGGAASSEDDLTYWFQARLFASGQIMLPVSSLGPLADALDWWWTIPGAKGLCSYQVPGHSLLLVPGAWLGNFSVVPVLQAAMTCFATYRAALLLFGRRTAVLALALFVTSPYMVTVFASYSASTSVAFTVSLALWAWAALLTRETTGRAFMLGVCIGLVCWVRPSAAVFLALPIAVWLLVRMARGTSSWRIVPAGLAGVLPLVALYLGYCSHVSGHFSITPGDVYWHRLSSGQFSPSYLVDAPNPHSIDLPGAVVGLARLNLYLHGWPVSLLPLAVLPLLPGKGPRTWVLVVPVLCLLAFYAFYRAMTGWYYFEFAPIMYILSARSILLTRLWTRSRRWRSVSLALPRFVCAGVFLSCFQSIPLSMARQHSYVRAFNNLHEQVTGRLAGQRTAVLMDQDAWDRWGEYLTGRNSPFLDDTVIYLNASKGNWSRHDLESVAGPRVMYKLRILEGRSDPLKLDRVPGMIRPRFAAGVIPGAGRGI